MKSKITILLFILFSSIVFTQTIEQKLKVVQNDRTNGGNFKIVVQVKGTNLPSANTLGSATIDIYFDNTKLTYVNTSAWSFGSADGYNCAATNNLTFIRIGITGSFVNSKGGGTPKGFSINTNYTTWAQLNFKISNLNVSTKLTINPVSNAIGLFENHLNEPNTGVINNISLTAPENLQIKGFPLKLIYFVAKQEGEIIYLSWETNTEINIYGFDVERSKNNKDWDKIGFVDKYDNNNLSNKYSFIDENIPLNNKLSYRLKQSDINGNINYSDVLDVKILPSHYKLYQNYPNPFNPMTRIEYQLPQPAFVILKIYNSLGKEISTLVNERMEGGRYYAEFNAADLPSGIYFCWYKANSYMQTMKILHIK